MSSGLSQRTWPDLTRCSCSQSGVVFLIISTIIEGLPPMPPTPLLEVLSMFQNQNLLRSILSVQGGSC